MKFFCLLAIYRTRSWIQIGSIYEPGQKLTLMNKILQNPSKSCDFEHISQFCTILIGFCLFLEFCYKINPFIFFAVFWTIIGQTNYSFELTDVLPLCPFE